MRILGRLPDPGGLANFNRLMNQGLSEAMMREALLRSPEYAEKNPDLLSRGRRIASTTLNKPSRRSQRKDARQRA